MSTASPFAESSVQPELDQALLAHRRELTAYCYRMLGAWSEAEDAVQETMLRAWKAYGAFEGRASLRSWLYRIAGNVCIDMQRSSQRRALPMEMGPSSNAAEVVAMPARLPEQTWLQPIPDEQVIDLDGDPAAIATARDTIRLAFVAALQHLPAKQRSALILCEVLQWQASEVAELLRTTVASVNSALQRARATMASLQTEELDSPLDPAHREKLSQYAQAFERYDIPALVAMLRDDVVLSMPPHDLWLQGPGNFVDWLTGHGSICKDGKLIPVQVNGSAAFGNYHLVSPGVWEPWAIQIVEFAGGKIIGHHNFLYPEWFGRFGLPGRIEA